MAAPTENANDVPRQSSAAQCISLSLSLDNDNEKEPQQSSLSFGPEFTHQCFPGEWINGYQPATTAILGESSDEEAAQHSSHRNHSQATHLLNIQVKLAPSCQTCEVNVHVQPKPRERHVRSLPTREAKRRRIMQSTSSQEQPSFPSDDDETTEEQGAGAVYNNDSDNDSDYSQDDLEENIHPNDTDSSAAASALLADDDNDGGTRTTRRASHTRRMPVDEIIRHCSKALPTIVENVSSRDSNYYLSSPIGTIVQEYQRRRNNNNTMHFVMSLASGPEAADYHEQVQRLALWFIETADEVDLRSTEGGGHWKVLYLFLEDTSQSKYSLVGYMTIFFFTSPFRKPTPGTIARVCQVLILPPYQRMGHGRALLEQVYSMASSRRNDDDGKSGIDASRMDDIVEVNVEDPAPACQRLRNLVDFELLTQSLMDESTQSSWFANDEDSAKYACADAVGNPTCFFAFLSEAAAIRAATVARITPRQVQIAYEIYKLSLIPNDASEEVHTKYRLMVKKRLAKVHAEELGACPSKHEKQALLAKLFDETLEQYMAVLKRNN